MDFILFDLIGSCSIVFCCCLFVVLGVFFNFFSMSWAHRLRAGLRTGAMPFNRPSEPVKTSVPLKVGWWL